MLRNRIAATRYCLGALLCLVVLTPVAQAAGQATLDALAEHTEFWQVELSPDGTAVAFLTARGMPREDLYHFDIGVVDLVRPGKVHVIAAYETVDWESHAEDPQFSWSPNGQELLFLETVSSTETTLRLWDRSHLKSRTLLAGHRSLHLNFDATAKSTVTVFGKDPFTKRPDPAEPPPDRARRMLPNDTFWGPSPMPQPPEPSLSQSWRWRWTTEQLVRDSSPEREMPPDSIDQSNVFERAYRKIHGGYRFVEPDSALVSPDGRKVAQRLQWMLALDPRRSNEFLKVRRVLVQANEGSDELPRTWEPTAEERDGHDSVLLGWSADSRRFYWLEHFPNISSVRVQGDNGIRRTVYEASVGLRALGPQYYRGDYSFNARTETIVLVRSSSLAPEDLVSLDLKTGKLTELYAPNAPLIGRFHADVRFMTLGDDFPQMSGRLYLPSGKAANSLPLVITLYVSSPGFEHSTGDEIPILALVEQGVAVFTFDAHLANQNTPDGRFDVQIARLEPVRKALEYLIDRLSREGVIDPGRVGLAGLSYGSEISMYCYWKSTRFRAISSATASWEPSAFIFVGQAGMTFMERSGFRELDAASLADWKSLSAGFNARSDLPPLLWQSPDSERNEQLYTWQHLLRAGAPVEWYEYPNDQHWKRGPANKWWVYVRNLDWFRFWLQDYEDPSPQKREQYGRWRAMRRH